MILLDTETTGLPGVSALPVDKQPEIIEFAALKLDEITLEERASFIFKCRPKLVEMLDPVITKITGITWAMIKDQHTFVHYIQDLTDFFLGERTLVAHNLPFDRDMLRFELKRIGREIMFPWPPEHRCTVELTHDIQGKPSKQEWLFEHYTGKKANQTHRALDDVRQLATVVRYMREEGRI